METFMIKVMALAPDLASLLVAIGLFGYDLALV
jgi:hypothetical protein